MLNKNNRPFLFLDCDGVLNNMDTTVLAPNGLIGIDPDNFKVLVKIIRKTKARIVLTSTWQENPVLLSYLKKKLLLAGIKLYDVTNENSIYRGHGVTRFMADYPDTPFVVIDDFEFPDFQVEGLMPHFVQTDYYRGLIDEDYEKVLDILQR